MSNTISLSELNIDVTQFKSDLESYLTQNSGPWKGNLTTMVGTALIDSMSTIGTFLQERINSAYINSFTDTAVIDDAIFAIATMKGIRLTRRLPASMEAKIISAEDATIPAYSQFSCVGYSFFNRETIELTANQETSITLYQGDIRTVVTAGLGTDLQSFASPQDSFQVSDIDTVVLINDQIIEKSYGNLWNYKNQDAFIDMTLSDGRLLVQFGNDEFGAKPGVNDTVGISYVVTEGESGNNITTLDAQITLNGFNSVTGTATSNPVGGSSAKSAYDYKNNITGVFGTYGSAVTPSQYRALVNTYPGIVDAITRSQRELDPSDLRLMNVVFVTGITSSPWTDQEREDFIEWLQQQTMASTRFVWVEATPVSRDIDVSVYCFSSAILSNVKTNVEAAIKALFEPRPGILDLDIFKSDLITAIRNADSNISYAVINLPVEEMIVTQESSTYLAYEIIDSGGQLTPYFYSYAVSYVNTRGEESKIDSWVHPQVQTENSQVKLRWRQAENAKTYKIYGRRSEDIGLIKEIEASSAETDEETGLLTWTDDGSITPDPEQFIRNRIREIKYNQLGELTVNVQFADRQQVVNTLTPIRKDV